MASCLLLMHDRAMVLFYPMNNDHVKGLLYERVEHAYGDNYVIVHALIREYLDVVTVHTDESERIHALVNIVGNFDQIMSRARDIEPDEYMHAIAAMHDFIDDNPHIISEPMHDQFFARLYDVLVYETQILPHAFARFRGFREPDA